MIGARGDAVLGELAVTDIDLAAPTDGAAAAHRVDIDTQRARRLQDGSSNGESSALARWGEDDERVLFGHGVSH
jgi:hypothetical protein